MGSDFLLPDWNNLFEPVNAITGGIEYTSVPVSCRTGNQYRGGAREKAADPLYDGNSLH
jgi:hypothetical protein